jgi:hypothetical protein
LCDTGKHRAMVTARLLQPTKAQRDWLHDAVSMLEREELIPILERIAEQLAPADRSALLATVASVGKVSRYTGRWAGNGRRPNKQIRIT